MNTNSKDGFRMDDFDLRGIWHKILKNLGMIFALSAISAMLLLLVIMYLYKPKYEQNINFYVDYATEDNTKFLTYLEDTNTIASSITKIITSELTLQKLENELGKDEDIALSARIIGSTNLFSVTLLSNSAEETYRASKVLVNIIPQIVTELYGDAPVTIHDISRVSTPEASLSIKKMIAVSIGFGCLIGCLIILIIVIKDFYHNTIKNSEQCVSKLGEMPIMTIPYEKKKKRISLNSSNLYTKSFGSFANKLISNKTQNTCENLLFVSSSKQEGVSTILANTAISLAKLGFRVAMVDLNLRNPNLCNIFQVESEALSELIRGSKTTKCITPITELSTLQLLGNITPSENSVAGITSENLKLYLKNLSEDMDFILFDSPSLDICSDAQFIAKYTDNFLIVVRRDTSLTNTIKETQEFLIKTDTSFYGFIFNDEYKNKILKEDSVTKMFIGRSSYGTKKS